MRGIRYARRVVSALMSSHGSSPKASEAAPRANCLTEADDSGGKFIQIQYQEALETYRAQFTLIVQIITALVIADVTLVGIAVASRMGMLIAIGAVFPLMILYILDLSLRLSSPLIYIAVSAEEQLGKQGSDLLVSTFLSTMMGESYLARIKSILAERNQSTRAEQRVTLPEPRFKHKRFIRTRNIAALIALCHMLAPLPLSCLFSWQLL